MDEVTDPNDCMPVTKSEAALMARLLKNNNKYRRM